MLRNISTGETTTQQPQSTFRGRKQHAGFSTLLVSHLNSRAAPRGLQALKANFVCVPPFPLVALHAVLLPFLRQERNVRFYTMRVLHNNLNIICARASAVLTAADGIQTTGQGDNNSDMLSGYVATNASYVLWLRRRQRRCSTGNWGTVKWRIRLPTVGDAIFLVVFIREEARSYVVAWVGQELTLRRGSSLTTLEDQDPISSRDGEFTENFNEGLALCQDPTFGI